MLEPRVRMLLRVQTRHCRHRARSEAVAVEYAHAAGAFYGPSGLGVEQVAIVLTFIVNPPRIVATRGDGCVRQLQSAEATGAVRVPNTHAPGCAVIAISDGGDIAGELNQRRGDAQASHQADNAVCRIFFGESAQIDLHARSRQMETRCLPLDLVPAHQLAC